MSNVPRRIAILGAVRTPIGKYGGSLRSVPAVRLGILAVSEALRRAHVRPDEVPELLFGQAIEAGAGQNPARQVALGAGAKPETGATTVNMVCGSGMKAILFGVDEIRAGSFDLVVAGGMESMSSAPYLVPSQARWGLRFGPASLDDSMLRDSLLNAYGEHEHMGLTGERIAHKFGISRAEADAFALQSHLAADQASKDGTFAAEIVAVRPGTDGSPTGLERDEGPRGDSTLEGLARLKPAFTPQGILTAGNSSQLSDGAAALVLASEEEALRRGVSPIAWIRSGRVGGVLPADVMEAPIPTVRDHLAREGLTPKDFDRVEHNEAFASASIAVQRTFGFTEKQFNLHGGAVALGHPIGASGCRIVVTLLYELLRSKTHRGLATLCMGGGNGLSLIVERD